MPVQDGLDSASGGGQARDFAKRRRSHDREASRGAGKRRKADDGRAGQHDWQLVPKQSDGWNAERPRRRAKSFLRDRARGGAGGRQDSPGTPAQRPRDQPRAARFGGGSSQELPPHLHRSRSGRADFLSADLLSAYRTRRAEAVRPMPKREEHESTGRDEAGSKGSRERTEFSQDCKPPCSFCNLWNHTSSSCRYLNNPDLVPPERCSVCLKLGHNERNCRGPEGHRASRQGSGRRRERSRDKGAEPATVRPKDAEGPE